MVLKLVVPTPNQKDLTVKDLVLSILAYEHPLSITGIYNIIKKKYGYSTSYQGVRKAVGYLVKDNVLVKNGKLYEINKEWITHTKNYLQSLERSYFRPIKQNVELTSSSKDYKEYKFRSLYELDIFWGIVIDDWANDVEKEEEKIMACSVNHFWWMLINLGTETKLNQNIKKRGIKFYIISGEKNPLDKWAIGMHKKYGNAKGKTIKKKGEEYVDVNVLGNLILEVVYPEEIVKKLNKFYKKHKKMTEENHLEISNICHEETEITFKVLNDPNLARILRNNIISKF